MLGQVFWGAWSSEQQIYSVTLLMFVLLLKVSKDQQNRRWG